MATALSIAFNFVNCVFVAIVVVVVGKGYGRRLRHLPRMRAPAFANAVLAGVRLGACSKTKHVSSESLFPN